MHRVASTDHGVIASVGHASVLRVLALEQRRGVDAGAERGLREALPQLVAQRVQAAPDDAVVVPAACVPGDAPPRRRVGRRRVRFAVVVPVGDADHGPRAVEQARRVEQDRLVPLEVGHLAVPAGREPLPQRVAPAGRLDASNPREREAERRAAVEHQSCRLRRVGHGSGTPGGTGRARRSSRPDA
jgi:hypothetical protein